MRSTIKTGSGLPAAERAMKSKMLHIRLEPEELGKIQMLADTEERGLSEAARRLIKFGILYLEIIGTFSATSQATPEAVVRANPVKKGVRRSAARHRDRAATEGASMTPADRRACLHLLARLRKELQQENEKARRGELPVPRQVA